jgi:glyoxylase-like metal-dependent hydrolase (beta-lactamase superfamily II)
MSAALFSAAILSADRARAQQPDLAQVTFAVTDLGNKTYAMIGAAGSIMSGGNLTFAVGDDAVILVDSQFAPQTAKVKAAIATVTNLPIRYVVITHFHGDHSGGIANFAKDGAVTVVSHVNVRKRLSEGTTNGLTGAKTPPVPDAGLPVETYSGAATTIEIKGRTAEVKHPQNAHTDGDSFVFFADANVLSTGDTVTFGRYPNIDFANGGNVTGMIAAADGYLQLVNDSTRIVPGHGPVGGKAELTAYRTMLVTSRDRIAKLIAEGKSEDEVIAARPMADLDRTNAANDTASRNWLRVVYNSLKPKT